MLLPLVALPEPVITVHVRFGSFAPAAVSMLVRVTPHPDNREVCWGLLSEDGDSMASCREITGDSPKTQPLIIYPHVSEGHYDAFAQVHRIPSETFRGGVAGRDTFRFRVLGPYDSLGE